MQAQVNEDELQKAIDDITNSAQDGASAENTADELVAEANNEAAAAPDGDLPDFGAPLAPVVPEPGAMPDAGMVAEDPNVAAAAVPVPADVPPVVAAPEAAAPAIADQPMAAEPAMPQPMEAAPMMTTPEAMVAAPEVATVATGDMSQMKANLLRDLTPLMDKIAIEPERKFHIYQDMMTTNGDKSVIPAAYESARQITDEQQRGEALLALLDAVDN